MYEVFSWVTIFEECVDSLDYATHNCMVVLNVLREMNVRKVASWIS